MKIGDSFFKFARNFAIRSMVLFIFFPTLFKKQEKTILLKSLKFSTFHQIRSSRVYLCRSIIHEILVVGSWKFNHVRIKYFSFSMQNFSSLAFEISDLPTNFQKSKIRIFQDFRVGPSISKFLALWSNRPPNWKLLQESSWKFFW